MNNSENMGCEFKKIFGNICYHFWKISNFCTQKNKIAILEFAPKKKIVRQKIGLDNLGIFPFSI